MKMLNLLAMIWPMSLATLSKFAEDRVPYLTMTLQIHGAKGFGLKQTIHLRVLRQSITDMRSVLYNAMDRMFFGMMESPAFQRLVDLGGYNDAL